MAGNKYLSHNGGNIQEVASVNSSAGAGDANKIVSLNAAGQIDETMLPQSPAVDMVASEAIAAGDLVNIWNDSGDEKVRKATNTGIGTRAHGYAPAGISEDATGQVILGEGVISGLSSLTPGATYFLGTGGAAIAAGSLPTSTNNIVQEVGVAKSDTELAVNLQKPIVLA